MQLNPSEISELIKKRIEGLDTKLNRPQKVPLCLLLMVSVKFMV